MYALVEYGRIVAVEVDVVSNVDSFSLLRCPGNLTLVTMENKGVETTTDITWPSLQIHGT